jgi:vancomycin resistance protein YoaR
MIEEPPALSTADLEALGINEIVSEFSTVLTANTVRTNNLRRGAELITGVLLLPGDTFSLTESISPINAENGFGNAGVIVAGNFTEGMGGGLSQLATTAYNAGFFAGFEDIEHRPHSLFINRYPAGREATLVTGSLDMRFRNNTPYGALVQSWVAGNRIHVAIWSTPFFRVETQVSERTEVTPPIIEERSGPNCVHQSPGPSGFRVTNFRQVFRLDNNERVIDEQNTWRYRPTNGIRCIQ